MSVPWRKQDGFTLIELLVVILIIGILAAIAIPAFLSRSTHCGGTYVGAKRSWGASTETIVGSTKAATIAIPPGNQGVAWQTHGQYRVTDLYFWRPRTSPEKPVHRGQQTITAASAATTNNPRLPHGSVIKAEICLTKEKS